MAKYGYTLYGLRRYGQLEGNQVYYQADIYAYAFDYGKVAVAWNSINVDPNDPNPTHWKLIRTQNGVPDHPDQGTLLAGGVITSFAVAYTDTTADAVAGQEVYYSIWLFNGLDWINCGSSTAFVTAKSDTLLNLTRRMPGSWVNDASGVGDVMGSPESGNQLYQWLSALAFEYDRMRLQTELVAGMSDYRKIPKVLLPSAVLDAGMPYEPTLGDLTHRSLYRVGHLVNSTKGTAKGITSFTSALTHWGSSVTKGSNLMLDYDDSSFEETTGRWAATAGTLAQVAYADTETVLGSAIAAPSVPLYNRLFPPRAAGFGLVTSTSTSSVVLSLGTSEPKLYGIPVTPDTDYIFKGWGLALDTAKTGTVRVNWYNATGTALSAYASASISVGTTWGSFEVYGTAPAGAVYAGIVVTIASTSANKRFAIDLMHFSAIKHAEQAGQFEDARTAHVIVDADRTNYLHNPGFDNGLSGWFVKDAKLELDFNPSVSAIVFGSAAAKMTATASTAAFISEWTPVNPGTALTFSAFVSTGTSGRHAVARVEFTTPQSAADQIAVLQDEDGQYFATDAELVNGSTTALSTKTRVSVTAQAPVFVPDNGQVQAKVSIYFTDAQANDEFWFDGMLLESHPEVREFFQGNGGPAPTDPLTQTFIGLDDCRWEWAKQTNMVNNPNFDSTTGWSGNSGTTISSVSTGGGYTPFAGNHMLKVNRTASGTAKVTTNVVLDAIDRVDGDVYGGDDVTVTARVIGITGDVTIDVGGAYAKTFHISAANSGVWTTIHTSFITTADQTNFDINISYVRTGAGAFYVDAVQAEYGRLAGPFVDNSEQTVVTRPNNNDPSKVVWEYYGPQTGGGGRSYYWARYYNKYERLKDDLGGIMPLGSSWAVVSGIPTPDVIDSSNSLVIASSFESSMISWQPVQATLKRYVSQGSHYADFGAAGSGWATATSTAADTFGFYADPVSVIPNAGYYASVAVRPTLASVGDFTLKIDWLDSNGSVLWSAHQTVAVTHTERWTYIGLTDKNIHQVGPDIKRAKKAKVSILCDATTPAIGISFRADRVLFRQ
jgi:hypothetical protein